MANELKITTTEKFENIEIIEYLNPVIAHAVVGMNIFKDFMTAITDIVGGSSSTYENTLESINNEVLLKLKQKAKNHGANCILNLRIENNEISANGKSMLMVTAIGTAAICDFYPYECTKRLKVEEYAKKRQIEEEVLKEKNDEILMKKYSIIYKDENYYLGDYKYSKLEDALSYAEILERKK